jgi:hypothetical protein
LRNPLNSILAKNIEKAALYQKMQKLFESFSSEMKQSDSFKECRVILDKLDEGREV